jgi:hypothetical protein
VESSEENRTDEAIKPVVQSWFLQREYVVCIVVRLKIQVVWDITPCKVVSDSRSPQHNFSEDLDLQQYICGYLISDGVW